MSDTPTPQAPQAPKPRRRPHVQFGLPSIDPSTPPQSVNVTLASPKGGKRAGRARPHVQFGPPPAQRDPSAPPPPADPAKVSKAA